MIPNYLHIVEQVKLAHPQAWKDAHTGNVATEDFIRLVAAEMYAHDSHVGLNGKRGNPKDISDDALNYYGEGPDYDPTHANTPATVIDVIGAAGTPQAYPQWLVVSDPNAPVAAAWVSPVSVTPPPPTPTPPPYQYPDENTFWTLYTHEVKRRYPGGVLNDESFRWFSRCGFSCHEMKPEDAAAKHLAELDAITGGPL